MERLGTEQIQLERVFRQCSPMGLHWTHVREGYQTETRKSVNGLDYVFILTFLSKKQ